MDGGDGRTAYVDFSTKVSGFDTDIKILETNTHIFIYVSQCEETIHLYDEALRKEIVKNKVRPKKKLVVFCNMKVHENFNDIKNVVLDILRK
ncbi:hypothetical protein KMI_06g09800 [Encephalitozoon hellem]|uniref:Uncharacterized protein n=1 Tax=Encephalitozoon hellem TaxID=27973 RepID=A0A9Q9C303_ENCHE|nr:uncharacterized protein EHEL_020145 [Encephalitozoon hellem ATCC 50504]AHL28906.1 hypothetical protein EHEL_020145 [Encephalitozoon hellem ATCC 50504]KAG5859458.1 hypothetical protein KMI_06g09800 [Encephalitozoon hellem]UTX42540.1 hypothetical protein GPU96_02g02500 [Encephalitozoon hellem]WEL37995.1 hypothetical protein PFJ87_02g00310 [Encephalitozoon hellem]